MTPPTWSPGGRILFNASRVYYVPDEPSLPPLRWMPEQQRFAYLSKTNDEDIALRASLTELVEACSQLYQLQSVQQQQLPTSSLSGYLPCEAIYGILPLGSASNSALLYVSEKDYVCTLHVGGATHEIFAVRALQWLLLPCATSALPGRQRGARRHRNRRGSPRSGHGMRGASSGGRGGAGGPRGSPRRGRDGPTPAASGTSDEDGEEMSEEEEEEEDESSSGVMGRLPTKTLNAYLDVLNRFCESVSASDVSRCASATAAAAVAAVEETTRLPGIMAPPGRFSYLYYSPTLDLSADPLHLLALLTHSPHPHVSDCTGGGGGAAAVVGRGLSETTNESLSSNPHRDGSGTTTDSSEQHARQARRGRNGSGAGHAWEELRAAAVTRQLYQWNGPLLGDAFAVPLLGALCDESLGADNTAAEAPRPPWTGVCADELLREELARRQLRGGSGSTGPAVAAAGAGVPAAGFSSLPLYVPSFIRGLVAQAEASAAADMTLVTRMCCRWAGTRYNRRGLEPGHSGVVANMAMSSLWVTPRASGEAKAAANARHFAVYTTMRGSVPRRWEQPANLAFKPTIKIAPVGNAAEELGRHVRLLKLSLPHLQTLYCLDTMSLSKLEEPLSEAYAAAVRRYNEDANGKAGLSAPLTGTGPTAAAAEDRDGGAATAVTGEGGAAAAAVRDPSVTLVKYNVKTALKRLGYAEMLQECTAQLDAAAGMETWVDFTRGEARAPVTDEGDAAAEVGAAAGHRSGSPPCGSPTGPEGDSKAAAAEAAATSSTPASRLVLANVQTRLVRVNCLDCLDRTNLVQSMLFCAVLPHMIAYMEGKGNSGDVVCKDRAFVKASFRLRQMLASQGTAISQLYAGTEPHFVPYMLYGHHHWTYPAVESALALRRWYQQNFYDGEKQDGVALVTRQHDPQVFNADIESPFSRDLRGMNHQVLYGLLLGVLPFLYSALMCLMERSFASSVFQLHFGVGLCWLVYLFVLYSKLMRYRTTYTNRPLLLYTRQADWC